jgi:hypothetical protein
MTVQSVQVDVAALEDDTWQLLEMTHGRLNRRTGRQLGQSMGDMCHHCKGDTWHGMMSAGTVADT